MSAPPTDTSVDRCSNCALPLNECLDRCLACNTAAAAPNVRRSSRKAEIDGLEVRFQAALKSAQGRGTERAFKQLVQIASEQSFVVVAMPATVARELFRNRLALYAGYENQVLGKVRAPAEAGNDLHRNSVGGTIFGSYAGEIRYGVLSLEPRGPSSYGDVFCRLNDTMISNRVTFLEENSYGFVERHQLRAGMPLPLGYTAIWLHRAKLVATKLAPRLKPKMRAREFGSLLLKSGANRQEDDFIEAHIYGPLTRDSILSCTARSKSDRDARIALELFAAKRQP